MTQKTNVECPFVENFTDLNLFEFAECVHFFETLDLRGLLAQYERLLTTEIRNISFDYSGPRHYALIDAIINFAANQRDIPKNERVKLINVSIDLVEYSKNRTNISVHESIEILRATLFGIRTYSIYPIVADLVEKGVRDYQGPFERSDIEAVLERFRARQLGETLIRLANEVRQQ